MNTPPPNQQANAPPPAPAPAQQPLQNIPALQLPALQLIPAGFVVQQQPQPPLVSFHPVQRLAGFGATQIVAPAAVQPPRIPPNPPNRLVISQVAAGIGSVGAASFRFAPRPARPTPQTPPPAPFIDYSNPDDPEDFDAEPPDL